MPEITNYQLWCTTEPIPFADFLKAKSNCTSIRYDDLDDVLGAARNGLRGGLCVHLIEGDDGTTLMLPDIEKLIETRGRALHGRPKKY